MPVRNPLEAETPSDTLSVPPLGRASLAARWAIVFVPGALLYFFPLPFLNLVQRHLLAIFAAGIIALVARPVAMGIGTTAALVVLALTNTVPADQIFCGYSNPTVWLIFSAFLFARAVISTGFGVRVAYAFIHRFGRSPLTLGYSIAASDFVLAPFIPQTRRAAVASSAPLSKASRGRSDPNRTGTPSSEVFLPWWHSTRRIRHRLCF